MNFIVSASTDKGNVKNSNQDSLNVKIMTINGEKVVFAVLCDGMGGLEKGEVASTTMVQVFSRWILERMPVLMTQGITDAAISKEWTQLIVQYNDKIKQYGKKCAISLGTTLTAVLIAQGRYFIVNVGDTRIYEIKEETVLLTKDQTVVAREVESGNLTPEQAARDSRRNVLLQCIGASDAVYPDYFFGEAKKDAVYMLCSDGFRHEITPDEIYAYLCPDRMISADEMKQNEVALINLNKERQETDNISVITIRTY